MQKGTLIAAALVLAGCLAPAADPGPVEALAADDAAQAFRVPVEGSPATTLTAAWWTIPASAVVPSDHDEDESVVAVEASLVLPAGAKAERWAVFAFQVEDGALVPAMLVGGFPTTGVSRTPLGEQPFEEEVVVEPFLARLAHDARPGDRVALVVALQTAGPAEAELVFRPLAADLTGEEEPHEEALAFLASLDAAPRDVPVAGSGEGMHLGGYFALNLGVPFPLGFEVRTGDVDVVDEGVLDTRPLPHVDRIGLSSRMEGEAGWGVADAFVLADAGAWAIEAEARSAQARGWGVLTPNVGMGWAGATAMGDGEGQLRATMRVDAASARFDTLGFIVLGFGATLEDLTGVPGASEERLYGGPILGAAQGDDLVLTRAGSEWRLVGALPAA